MIALDESLGGWDAPMKDHEDNNRNRASIRRLCPARTRWNFNILTLEVDVSGHEAG
jgi:hypothetical protein